MGKGVEANKDHRAQSSKCNPVSIHNVSNRLLALMHEERMWPYLSFTHHSNLALPQGPLLASSKRSKAMMFLSWRLNQLHFSCARSALVTKANVAREVVSRMETMVSLELRLEGRDTGLPAVILG